jgi:tripartite-type tricarboxylate transporter receptor subunit TctC
MEACMRGPQLFLVLIAWLGQAVFPANAQDWPTRPLTMVYPFAAGSAGDVVGRAFASRLSELLGQPVIFENVAGAGGMVGASRVAKAAPDGHMFMLGGTFLALSQTIYRKPLYNAVTDLIPVALLLEQPTVLIARTDFPATDLQEFAAYARANQGRMQYGSAGAGSIVHLACVLLNAAIGIDVVHVPYRGGAGALQDLIGGRIDYQCPIITIALPQIESRTVKALAVLSKDRSPALPNVASAHEQGLTNLDVDIWYAFFLPRDTPAFIVRRLHDATVAAMETPAVQEQLRVIGATLVAPERRSPEYLRRFMASEIDRWAAPIKASGAQVD